MNDYDQALLDSLRYDGPASPYAPVTAPLIPPDWRCTAYYYALNTGLPVAFDFLLELGQRAARIARWHGIGEARVLEDPYGLIPPVHTWPEFVWREAAATFFDPYDDPGHGYWEAGDYG